MTKDANILWLNELDRLVWVVGCIPKTAVVENKMAQMPERTEFFRISSALLAPRTKIQKPK
ncbi:MAG: hypothetical protein ACK5GN_05880 [Pseudomonadota bacterium]|jgi:hypothetical protein